jgi:uncharacterized delta-60 repeat protein
MEIPIMFAETWLQVLAQHLRPSGRRSPRRPARRSRSIPLIPEGLEHRTLLAGGPPAGSLDPTFGQGGLVTHTEFGGQGLGAAALQPDGKIVAAEVEVDATPHTIAVERFLSNGQHDTGFAATQGGEAVLDPGFKFNDPEAVAVINHPGSPDDGKIVVAGSWSDPATNNSGVALARFNPDGSVDTSFGSSGAVVDTRTTSGALALAIQPDDKILVVGATLVNSTQRGFVERFNADGTPDSGFANPGVATAPTGWSFQWVSALALDPTQGLFVAGFTAGATDIAVAHLTTGGQLDPSFGTGGIATAVVGNGYGLYGVNGLAIDPTRGLVVAASTTPGGPQDTGDRAIVTRFDFGGSLDPSFNHGALEFVDFQGASVGINNDARAVAVQPDGKVLLAGATGSIGFGEFALARLNTDGTLDRGFGLEGVVIALPNSAPRSLLLQPDGNIVVTGQSSHLVTARFIGGSGAASVTPQPPLVGPITTPGLVLLGTVVLVSASFTYNIPTDRHTAVWDWGDHTTSTVTPTEANGSGSVTGRHVYAAPGIYPVTLTVTDQRGASGSATAIPGVVVYELIVGGITGSGLINGPPLMVAAATPAGQVRFRLAAKYAANRTVPQGVTVLQFKSTHRTFRSTALDWLVVSGDTAWCEGTGTIDGAGSYGFLVAASGGGGGAGKVRIRIWDEASGAVVYDSQPGTPIGAAPATAISRGRIVLRHGRGHKRASGTAGQAHRTALLATDRWKCGIR